MLHPVKPKVLKRCVAVDVGDQTLRICRLSQLPYADEPILPKVCPTFPRRTKTAATPADDTAKTDDAATAKEAEQPDQTAKDQKPEQPETAGSINELVKEEPLFPAPKNPQFHLDLCLSKQLFLDPNMPPEYRDEFRLNRLKEMLRQVGSWDNEVVCSLSGQSVFTRTRSLPPVPLKMLSKIVNYEISQQIPFSLDQIILDYHILNREPNGGYLILMAAIKADVIDKLLKIFELANCRVRMAIPTPIALYNWFTPGSEATGVEAVINLGASVSEIVIFNAGRFAFTRPLNIGGNDLTLGWVARSSCGFYEAETAKRAGAGLFSRSEDNQPMDEKLFPTLERMVSEINRTFSYFRFIPGGGDVAKVTLTGGTACLPRIDKYLAQQLGKPVEIANPMANVVYDKTTLTDDNTTINNTMSVALGLARRCLGDNPGLIDINFLPEQDKWYKRIKPSRLFNVKA